MAIVLGNTDINSALYFNGTNVGIGTTPTSKLDVNGVIKAGSIGINGAAPQTPLDVISNASGYGITLRGRSGDNASSFRFTSNNYATQYASLDSGSAYLLFGISASEQMRLTSTGLGIGTSAPASRLSSNVSGAGSVTALNLTNDNSGFAIGTGPAINFGVGTVGLGAFGKIEVLNQTATIGSNSYMAFSTRGGDVLAERLRIDSSGNVGIGTDSPQDKLHIKSNGGSIFSMEGTDHVYMEFYPRTFATGRKAYIGFGDTGAGTFTIENTDADSLLDIRSTGAIRIFRGGVERVSITDRTYLFSTATGNFGNRTLNLDGPSLQQPGIGFHAPGYSSAGIFKFWGGGGVFECRNSVDTGFTTIVAAAFTVGSDYRLKTDIVDLQGGLADIMNLSPKKYTLFEKGEKVRGFIAHEVSPHIPEAVSGEFNAEDEKGFPVYQTLDPASILATAVAAIQELKAIVDQQASEIQQLKEKLNA